MTPISLRIRELRKAKGWSQAELAERADVTQATVSRIERGKVASLDLEVFEKLADALDVHPAVLIDRRNLMNTRTWTDPTGRTWEVSIEPPPGTAMATDGKLGDAATLYIRFTDPTNRGRHPSVPYMSRKSLRQLTDEEIAVYWDQVVDKYPDLASA